MQRSVEGFNSGVKGSTTGHRLGENKLEESGLGESRMHFIHVRVAAIAHFRH
jgi:hypothetical protein